MSNQEELFSLIERDLENLSELISYDRNVRKVLEQHITLNIKREASKQDFLDFAQKVEETSEMLLDMGIINPYHVEIILQMISITITIQSSVLQDKLH